MTCKWSMDEFTDWWAGCGEFLTAWTDKEPPKYCPYCGERVEVEKRQLAYVHTCRPKYTGKNLPGTDCPAWECSSCGELFEASASYCSQCGAKVVEE